MPGAGVCSRDLGTMGQRTKVRVFPDFASRGFLCVAVLSRERDELYHRHFVGMGFYCDCGLFCDCNGDSLSDIVYQ